MDNQAHIMATMRHLLQKSPVTDTEVILDGLTEATTRFANNHIHQNVAEDRREIACRVVQQGQVGYARANQMTGQAAENMLQQAIARMEAHPVTCQNFQLVNPQQYKPLQNFDSTTAHLDAARRADIVETIINRVKADGLLAAGTVLNGFHEIGVVNSRGVEAFHRFSHFHLTLTVYDQNNASSWTAIEGTTCDPDEILPAVEKTVQRALRSKNPQEIPAGHYTVILEPAATGTFIENLGWLAFGAKDHLQKKSCLYNRIGENVTGALVTVYDDAYHPLSLGMPFDYEGTSKQVAVLIDKGVASGIVHDSVTARLMNTQSTGHSLPQPNPIGPIPGNLIMKQGPHSLEDIISDTKEGILITRFHYNSIVNEKNTALTGLTRDGTFFIRNGELAFPIKNLRYNERILGAFNRIEAISHKQILTGEYSKVVVPALKINHFHFTANA
ncbi:TldD/PmbA family protein [candidate division CSSED10-310 bacterium]|uniref:TldD/PmbA family protein n=1 Tax=candidate division CSSED10-310 bacterium TaxID=2855610 RepID=A0ABV6YTS0_UNCC1